MTLALAAAAKNIKNVVVDEPQKFVGDKANLVWQLRYHCISNMVNQTLRLYPKPDSFFYRNFRPHWHGSIAWLRDFVPLESV